MAVLVLVLATLACNRSRQADPQAAASAAASASRPARQLSPEDAKIVLAKVGEVSITLGDYAAALDRMDRFERLRYQSKDRRQILLDEMINLELLAQEATRQKLDQNPEVRLRLDEALRDEVLRDVRDRIPAPESLPTAEVRAYYETHRAEFKEPERRRAAAIVVSDEKKARDLTALTQTASPTDWGSLVRKHSTVRSSGEQTPLELEGDLGIVSAPGQPQGSGPKLAEPILKALFEIPAVGGVYPKPIREGEHYYVLRMTGRTAARERSFQEAERSIRVRMVEQRILAAEQELLDALKKEYAVTIDESALSRVKVSPQAPSENLKDALR